MHQPGIDTEGGLDPGSPCPHGADVDPASNAVAGRSSDIRVDDGDSGIPVFPWTTLEIKGFYSKHQTYNTDQYGSIMSSMMVDDKFQHFRLLYSGLRENPPWTYHDISRLFTPPKTMFTIATVPYVLPGNLFPKTSQNLFFFGLSGPRSRWKQAGGQRSWPSRWCQPGEFSFWWSEVNRSDILYGGWGKTVKRCKTTNPPFFILFVHLII